MSRLPVNLNVIDVATPCPADWNDMRGDERVRFCKHCSLHVYNLSDMTREAAERLVSESEGRMCVRFFRREDGTVVTKDCEGALLLAAKRVKRWAAAGTAFALWAVLAPLGLSRAIGSQREVNVDPVVVSPPAQPRYSEVKGDIAIPQPQIMGRVVKPTTNPIVPPPPIAVVGILMPPTPPTPPATNPAPVTPPATQPAQ
jgi:hypothetical protein